MPSLTPSPSIRSLMRRELEPRAYLPYARHITDTVVALDNGAVMTAFRLEGASFETADLAELNDRHAKLNGAWRNLADERVAIWHHLIRREEDGYPEGPFRSDFAADLDEAYRAELASRRLFINELYLTLVLHPGHRPVDRLSALFSRSAKAQGADAIEAAGQALGEIARDLGQHLGRYAPRALGLVERNGLWFSEPLELLRQILTGRREAVPLVRGHLGEAVYAARVIFGREALEIRDVGETRYAAMLGVKEYPAVTRPGLWDGLLTCRFPLVASQSFAFLSKSAARGVLERKQNQMVSARDRAASQIEGLGEALDDLTSNRFVMGDHQASVLVHAATPGELGDRLSRARSVLADSGLVAAREDLGLEGAFWAQFPGNFAKRVRPAAITSRNFAGLAPFHTYPAGRPEGNHWGPAVALLRTTAGSPFFFNFHVGDLGHTFICGPSGSGKTVIQNFLLAQLEKLGAQQVFVDKDRGAEIFVRACGGTYLTLRNGQPTGFAPLKALEYTPANQAFLGQLIRKLVTGDGERLPASAERAIDEAIAALAPIPAAARSLAALRALLGQHDADGIGARLERWTRGGALGWVLDNEVDSLAFDARFLGFDMTDLLDNAQVRTPAMMYLFHRLQGLVDGRRLVIDIDEFWKALGDEAFRGLAQDGLKTFRKQNAFMVFGTQSPADVLRSPIAHTILEQCATKVFLPNPQAAARDYVEGFGLTGEELRLVREELAPEQRRFLVKQGHDSVVVELDLSGLGDHLAVLSGRTDTVELAARLRAAHGEAPEAWLPLFHQQRRLLP
ncbi:MAG: VirB4 family type IV secretion/conjugal transfer ATPase [Phenylobacterium sp.]|uniref:VirB4 family type IV secretion/conjugal transfer ATPase n=1 Tax=Phenylobacterium sp. TaxID=1871053 RepID=UPI002732405B|nr:VirB4 family type IV secretion/conjugal transfer ATPase [Phenylobacterium sp.]MDP3749295.1 VirB4 family type IV secretion/conjugal transfer ATPase [Phenylobacterium sp.]